MTPQPWGDDNPFYVRPNIINIPPIVGDRNPYGGIGDTILLSPTLVADFRAGVQRINMVRHPRGSASSAPLSGLRLRCTRHSGVCTERLCPARVDPQYPHQPVGLSLIAYNLGNLWRLLVLPMKIDNWSLTSLQQRFVKTGGRLVKHARYYWHEQRRLGI